MEKGKRWIENGKAKEIYGLVRRQGIVSKLDLAEQSKMTVSTLTRVLDELITQGFMEEVGLGDSTGGRKPILYRTNPAYAYSLGLDISRTNSRLALCDMHMNMLASRSWTMDSRMTPEALLAAAAAAAEDMLEMRGLTRDNVLGVGIGAVGPVDRLNGMIVDPLYFPAGGWRNVEICRMAEERFGVPAVLDNGANTAVLGEYWADSARAFQHMLYLHAGVGLRSAMISNGKMVYGAVDMEGAVGQMIIQTDGMAHREEGGNYGALESYATIPAMEKRTQAKLKQGRQSVLLQLVRNPENVSFAHLQRALAEKDALAIEVFTQTATYFGIGLANLLNILHPEKVILGGPLINSHELFFRVATQVAVRNTYYYPKYQVMFSRGKLGEEALAAGAAMMVVDRLMDT